MLHRRFILFTLLLAGLRSAGAAPWEPSAAVMAEAQAFLARWFELVEQERYDDAYAYFSSVLKSGPSLAQWAQQQRRARSRLGALKGRSVRRLVWQDNPPRAPSPGVYLFAEYDCSYEKVAKHFEVVVLHLPPGGGMSVLQHQNRVTDLELGVAKWLLAQ
jgi:hypothetical protein